MTIRHTPPTETHMTVDALLRRIQADIDEIKRRDCTAPLKKVLAGELDCLRIETIAATPGALVQHPEYRAAILAANWDEDRSRIATIT